MNVPLLKIKPSLIITGWLFVISFSCGSSLTEIDFYEKVSRYPVAIMNEPVTTTSIIANQLANPINVTYCPGLRGTTTEPEYLPVLLLLHVLSNPQSCENWKCFKLSTQLKHQLMLNPAQMHFSWAELSPHYARIEIFSEQRAEWGSIEPRIIDECKILSRSLQIYTCVKNSFAILESSSDRLEEAYLKQIVHLKASKSKVQQALEGMPYSTDEIAGYLYFLTNTSTQNHSLHLIPSSKALISPTKAIEKSIDQFYLPNGLLSWLRLLDAFESRNIAAALQQAIAVERLTHVRHSSWKYNSQPTTGVLLKLVWITSLGFSAFLLLLYWKGVRKAYLPCVGFIGVLLIAHLLSCLRGTPIGLWETIQSPYLNVLLFLAVLAVSLSMILPSKRNSVVLLFIGWAIAIGLPQLKEQKAIENYGTLIAFILSILTIFTITVSSYWMIRFFREFKPFSKQPIHFRDHEKYLYPTVLLLLFCSFCLLHRFITTQSIPTLFVSIHPLPLLLIILISTHYLLLRWSNQLQRIPATTIITSSTLLMFGFALNPQTHSLLSTLNILPNLLAIWTSYTAIFLGTLTFIAFYLIEIYYYWNRNYRSSKKAKQNENTQ